MGEKTSDIGGSESDIKKHEERLDYILGKTKTQPTKFIEIARELGCDESEEAFNEKLKKLAESKPEPHKEEPAD